MLDRSQSPKPVRRTPPSILFAKWPPDDDDLPAGPGGPPAPAGGDGGGGSMGDEGNFKKGRFGALMEKIPVAVVLDKDVGLSGAAAAALASLQKR